METDVTQIIRTSDRGYFKKCRQLWDFTSKIRQNYEPLQRAEYFEFGSAIHAGMEEYYDPAGWCVSIKAAENRARQAFLDYISKVEQVVKLGALEFEMEFKEARQLGLDILENYFLWAPKNDKFTPLYVEVEFSVEIPGLGVPYQGRVDLIIEDDFGYWIVDHKTAQQFGAVEWLWLDDQCSSYAWALKKMLGLEIRGVIYNQIRKKAPHPPNMLKNGGLSVAKNQDTTYELYLKTLQDGGYKVSAYQDMLDFLKTNPKEFIRRTRIQFTPKVLELVEKRVVAEAREMLGNPAIYPTPSPWNCNGCRFFQPCLAMHEGSDYQLILDQNFVRRSGE